MKGEIRCVSVDDWHNLMRCSLCDQLADARPERRRRQGWHTHDFDEYSHGGTEFCRVNAWLNSGPLNIADLRGKVVLVDFWTYGCYNCVNTLPHVTRLYDTYKDRGFIVVGVHTPEFPFEKSTANVQAAIKRHGIRYPVAQDNEYATWNAYHNQYWPAQYIVDQNGTIVFEHAGEGQYEEIERTVQKIFSMALVEPRRDKYDLRLALRPLRSVNRDRHLGGT